MLIKARLDGKENNKFASVQMFLAYTLIEN